MDAPDETTLAQIFAKDPLELTNDDLDATVAFYRAQRHKFKEAQTAPKKEKKPAVNLNLNLGDLGL